MMSDTPKPTPSTEPKPPGGAQQREHLSVASDKSETTLILTPQAAVKAVCHDEQMIVWASDFVGTLSLGGWRITSGRTTRRFPFICLQSKRRLRVQLRTLRMLKLVMEIPIFLLTKGVRISRVIHYECL